MKILGNDKIVIESNSISCGSLILNSNVELTSETRGLWFDFTENKKGKILNKSTKDDRELYAISFVPAEGERIVNFKIAILSFADIINPYEFRLVGCEMPEFVDSSSIVAKIFTANKRGDIKSHIIWSSGKPITTFDVAKESKIMDSFSGMPKLVKKIPHMDDNGTYNNFFKIWKDYTVYVIDPDCNKKINEFISFDKIDESKCRKCSLDDFVEKRHARKRACNVVIVTDSLEFAKNARSKISEVLKADKLAMKATLDEKFNKPKKINASSAYGSKVPRPDNKMKYTINGNVPVGVKR